MLTAYVETDVALVVRLLFALGTDLHMCFGYFQVYLVYLFEVFDVAENFSSDSVLRLPLDCCRLVLLVLAMLHQAEQCRGHDDYLCQIYSFENFVFFSEVLNTLFALHILNN